MRSVYSWLYGALGGLAICLSYSEHLWWLIFFFLVPLLYLAHVSQVPKKDILISAFILLLIWNSYNLSFLFDFKIKQVGIYVPLVILANSMLGLGPFVVFATCYRSKYILFIAMWVIIEYIYSIWLLQSPFSSLGIVLANSPKIIQWYSVTGVHGGSLWILVVNIILLKIFILLKENISKVWHYLTIASLLLLTPVLISLYFPNKGGEFARNRKVKAYSFSSESTISEVQKHILEVFNDDEEKEVDFRVFPELVVHLNNELPEDNSFINKIHEIKNNRKWLKESTLMGVNLSTWKKQQVLAVGLDKQKIQVRYKEYLVPFGEYVPLFFKSIAERLDIVQSNLPQEYITPNYGNDFFSCYKDTIHLSICFESFFEKGLQKKLKPYVGALFVIAKEPFGNNKHYEKLSSLLTTVNAIVFNKYVVRSSWSGLSSVVNNKGEVLQSAYNENGILESYVLFNQSSTSFSKLNFNLVVLCSIILGVIIVLEIVAKRYLLH